MKFLCLVFLSSLSVTSVYASECRQNEAQFIGNITELHVVNMGAGVRDCTYKISFTQFNENRVCPLDFSQAQLAVFEDYLCSSKFTNGDEISGVIIERNGSVFVE